MNNNDIIPVIIAGGSGSRLWPLSRENYPKQFLSIYNDGSLLQNTIHRLDSLECNSSLIVCSSDHRFIIAEQLKKIHLSGIILEPAKKNTAPAIALAAFNAIKNETDPLLLVLPSDHIIKNSNEFVDVVNKAKKIASDGYLITFGIVPVSPETGYGYIQKGNAISEEIFKVSSFKEKPDHETAINYVSSGDYYWNSGMFLFKASVYLNELKKYSPDIYKYCELALQKSRSDLDFIRVDEEEFELCPSDSIDYAVMEKTDLSAMIPLNAGWSDIGSWSALWEISDKDKDGNVISGNAYTKNVSNCYISSTERVVAAIGLDNIAIVETNDAILVTHKDQVQSVKDIINSLKEDNKYHYIKHRNELKPWGSQDSIDEGERYQVKKVVIKPGNKISLQVHHHRAEHWIVVSGTAKVTKGDSSFILTENESTFIPIGEIHSIENPGKIPLELIEVRSGSYLDEDDILRLPEVKK
ncbi:mannose-1-phosphate guanylyltransferase/mannose-6-phosphate isomerase [Morganella morganii]|uniref:mannose-1-phosphate guanylyltransferase/mannose-6-phosphate isomerase n=1 Tax=Morganella morganii TaxID=582 RepID=UPI00285D27BB|nr:mannose-1-phosphate guanylyltransferase/mannose-6-phosphate isomerase [Morganella morganii]MDR5687006.1 mannose-1-phosphate guanylyltransferase/mannose-6-phosphate isomerase [Morganella morganii]